MLIFTTEEADAITDKLQAAADLILEAETLARAKDEKGESEVSIHIDSDYNNLTDTMSIVWRYTHA
jgi:hypothetical protein